MCAFSAIFSAPFSTVFASFFLPVLSIERAAVLIALIRSCSDKCAYQMSIVDIPENSVIASR